MDELDLLFYALTIVFLITSVAFPIRRAKQFKSKGLVMFALSWISYAISIFMEMMAYLVGSEMMFRVALGVAVPFAIIFWSLFIDFAQKDEVTVKRTAFVIFVVMLNVVWALDSSHVVYLIDGTYAFADPYFPFFSAMAEATIALSFLAWAIRLNRDVPSELKGKTRALSVVGIMDATSNVLNILNSVSRFDVDGFVEIMLTVSMFSTVLVVVYVLYKESHIMQLLPYRVYKLIVTSKQGNALFSFKWFIEKKGDSPFSSDADEDTFLSALFGIGNALADFTQKSMQLGSMMEMKMRKGIFITDTRFSKVNFGLLASRSSSDLRDSLDSFASTFVKSHSEKIYDEGTGELTINEKEIKDLIDVYFKNIPIRVAKYQKD